MTDAAFVMIAGTLLGDPVTRTTVKGSFEITDFKVRVGGQQFDLWTCSAFTQTTREALKGLSAGNPICVLGALNVDLVEFSGKTRVRRRLTASRIMALRPDIAEVTEEPSAG